MSSRSISSHEFSRVFKRADIDRTHGRETITATDEECAAVAQRLGLVAVNSLDADLEIAPWRRNGIAVSGVLRAEIVQTCVVSLEDFTSHVEEAVSARFTDENDPILQQVHDPASDAVIDPLEEDAPETLIGDAADVGELVVEILSVSLDTHPRRPGVELSDVVPETVVSELLSDRKPANPFAVLGSLRRPDGKD